MLNTNLYLLHLLLLTSLAATASWAATTPATAEMSDKSSETIVSMTMMAATQKGSHSRRRRRSFHHWFRLRGLELSHSRSMARRLARHMQNSCTKREGSNWQPALRSMSSPALAWNHFRQSGSEGIRRPSVPSASRAYSFWWSGPLMESVHRLTKTNVKSTDTFAIAGNTVAW